MAKWLEAFIKEGVKEGNLDCEIASDLARGHIHPRHALLFLNTGAHDRSFLSAVDPPPLLH